MDVRRLFGVKAGHLLLAGLALAILPQSSRAAVPESLDLTQASEAWRRVEPVPNPHSDLPCVRCHLGGGVSYKTARQFGMRLPLITGEEISLPVCTQCHEKHLFSHPVGFTVRRLADTIARAGVFPLETEVETYDKLTCISCHSVHFPHTATHLLRGFSIDGRFESGPFRSRLDFCRGCHGAEEVLGFSGHRSTSGDTGCTLCHEVGVAAGPVGPLKRALNQSCSFCHPPVSGESAHYAEYNPFTNLNLRDIQAVETERLQGIHTCATCHRHHRARDEAQFFTTGFVAAVEKSFQVNPHRTTRFCLSCHAGNPPLPGTPGAVAPLIDGDVTRLCRRCHDREQALRMQHPLVAPSPDVPAPAAWPLRTDNTLGCETCHLAGHGPTDVANPLFLRGAPYELRNEICFRCHHDDRGRRRNLHAEIAGGRGCDVCHDGPVTAALQPAGKVGALHAEPNLLCLLCHDAPQHPASAAHTVRPRPSSFLAIDHDLAPLTLGKITCHTCHDSHAANQNARFLRASADRTVCSNCHPY